MTQALSTQLHSVLPKAIGWAVELERTALAVGVQLDTRGEELASRVGVQTPQRIRLMTFSEFPLPDDKQLREVAAALNLANSSTLGLTLGCSIWIREGYISPRLLSHEFRHVHQYERAGSIAAFLPIYLQQIIAFGYRDAPLERDAREHEVHPSPSQ